MPISIIKEYIDKHIKQDKPDLIFLTGSRSLNYNNDKSDIDLCVIGQYTKDDLEDATHDFTFITKYPSNFLKFNFEIEYETIENLNLKFNDLLNFTLWKFQNAKLLYGTAEEYNKLKLHIDQRIAKYTMVWLCHHSKNIIKNIGDAQEKEFKIHKSWEYLIKLVFLINNKAIPIDRWLIKEYKKLPWQPKGLLSNKNIKSKDIKYLLSLHNKIFQKIEKNKLIPQKDLIYISNN